LWLDSRGPLYQNANYTSLTTLAGQSVQAWEDLANNNGPINSTGGTIPTLQFDPLGNQVVQFNPLDPDTMVFPSSLVTPGIGMSIYIVGRLSAGYIDLGAGGYGRIYSNLTNIYYETLGYLIRGFGVVMQGQNQDAITVIVASASATLQYQDGYSGTAAVSGANVNVGGNLGSWVGGAFGATVDRAIATASGPAWIKTVLIYDMAHTPAQVAQVQNYLKTTWGIPTRTRQVVCDGDSLTFGYTSALTFSTPIQTSYPWQMTQANLAWMTQNEGVPSQTLATCVTNAAANVDVYYDAVTFPKSTIVIFAGTNDIVAGSSAVSVESSMSAYVSARQAVGWKVVVVPVLDRASFTAPMEVIRLAVNAWINAGSSGANAIVTLPTQLAGTAPWVTYPAYWDSTDQTHLTSLGYGVLAQAVAAAIATT
jgi:lysophospholipase L1-like esterase